MLEYEKEYARLAGKIDQAITILEEHEIGDPIVWRAANLLFTALRDAEERYIGA